MCVTESEKKFLVEAAGNTIDSEGITFKDLTKPNYTHFTMDFSQRLLKEELTLGKQMRCCCFHCHQKDKRDSMENE